MKGLLLKDFYMMLKYCRSYALITAVFIAVSVFADNNSFLLSYPVIISYLIPQTLLAYEERARWNTYSLVFPYSKKQIVSSKYILTVIMLAGTLILLSAAMLVKSVVNETPKELVSETLISIAIVGIIGPSVTMPITFKYGTEKGRLIYLLATVLFFGLFFALTAVFNTVPNFNENNVVFAILAVCIALFALSWLISIRIYEKKEF